MGDLHYGNLETDDPQVYMQMLDRTFSVGQNQASLFRHVPLVYMYDDHDFGPNNADRYAKGRDAAIRAYRASIPSYSLAQEHNKFGAVYHRFSVGRVLFIVTDTSSERDPLANTTLGSEQLKWLLESIDLVKNKYAAGVWVTTLPWNDADYKWGEFKEEQGIVARHIQAAKLGRRFVIVSGDAHMVAVDDGSNAPGGVPVFHAAPMDAKPTTKGGPYSHGAWPGRNQFGTLKVVDFAESKGMKGEVCFIFSGWRWQCNAKLRRLVRFDTCNPQRTPRWEYTPSPYWARKIWKRVKAFCEPLADPIGRVFVETLDGCGGLTLTLSNAALVVLPSLSIFLLHY